MNRPAPIPVFARVRLGEIDSTNEEAKRRAAAGAVAGTVIHADRQNAGRGRSGRTWHSPPGNLYASLLLRPSCSLATALQLVFVTGVAVAAVVDGVAGAEARARCKWPNDVLVDGRKIGGILVESQASANGAVDWLVIGVGLNIVAHPDDTSSLYPATSLAAAGAGGRSSEALLDALLSAFSDTYDGWRRDGFSAVREMWLARAHGLGSPIIVRLADGILQGTFAGIDDSGLLLLDTAGGRRTVAAGDVFPAHAS